jgi:hypothetical protein
MRQGATSVVPKAQKTMLGFSPCGFVYSYLLHRSD